MAKHKYVTLEGIIEWAKIFESNRDKTGYQNAYVETDGRTTINLIMDDENFEKMKASGCMKRGRPDPEGRGTVVKFDRKWDTGRDWDSGEPEIFRPDGQEWDLEKDGYVGNGSRGLVQIVVSPTPTPNRFSTRIEKVKVIDHVKLVAQDPFTMDMSSDSNADNDHKVETSTSDREDQVDSKEDLDDEIPF